VLELKATSSDTWTSVLEQINPATTLSREEEIQLQREFLFIYAWSLTGRADAWPRTDALREAVRLFNQRVMPK
jgi:hypothetical protein